MDRFRKNLRYGSILKGYAKKKAIRFREWLFSVKFVPAERVKYADACEIAYGSEIRLRRVKERILFHIATNGSNISQFPQGNYFTFGNAEYFTKIYCNFTFV